MEVVSPTGVLCTKQSLQKASCVGRLKALTIERFRLSGSMAARLKCENDFGDGHHTCICFWIMSCMSASFSKLNHLINLPVDGAGIIIEQLLDISGITELLIKSSSNENVYLPALGWCF